MTVSILFHHLSTISNLVLGIANILSAVLATFEHKTAPELALVIITVSSTIYLFTRRSTKTKILVFLATVCLIFSFQRKLANPIQLIDSSHEIR